MARGANASRKQAVRYIHRSLQPYKIGAAFHTINIVQDLAQAQTRGALPQAYTIQNVMFLPSMLVLPTFCPGAVTRFGVCAHTYRGERFLHN